MHNKIICRLCTKEATFAFTKTILSKPNIKYYYCETCGSLQTQEPFWLDDAYKPINEQLDTGQFIRCLLNASFIKALHTQLNLTNELILDYGCGSGLTGRILRDVGINAYGYDIYSTPRLLMGFQKKNLEGAFIINLCEVAEHFPNPKESFEHIFSSKAPVLVMQTDILKNIDPNWGYLSPENGQHIFFYSEKSIDYIARKYEMSATFVNGFILFINHKILSALLDVQSFTLHEKFITLLSQSMPDLFNSILRNGYRCAIQDNQMLLSSMHNK